MKLMLKVVGGFMALFFTTGIVLPWVISNVVMPVWMIIATLGAVCWLWAFIMDKPIRRFCRFTMERFKNVD